MVCWVGRSKAVAVSTRSLKASSPPRALVLEGSLDDNLESERSEEPLLRTWLEANDVAGAYKNIHLLDDIEILSKGLKKNQPPFVHISCHGDHDGQGRAYIRLAPGQLRADRIFLDAPKTQDTFRRAFEGLPVYFSACMLGKYQSELQKFRAGAKLGPVAGFTRSVDDSETMLFELLLYQGVLFNGWTFTNSIGKACEALSHVEVRGGTGQAQSLVRVF
jgi:hypothetical protein